VRVRFVRTRIIHTNTTLNTRDLGGLKTIDNKKTRFNTFIRSDNLVCNEDSIYTIMDFIEKRKLKNVIDLRAKIEVEKDSSMASKIKGLRYNNISLVNFMPLGYGVPKEYNYTELYQWYIDIIEKSCKLENNTAFLEGVVSRKKQLIPLVEKYL
jgi:hypothetical protein